MRIVIALGGNALLRRGDPMTTEVEAAARFAVKTGGRAAIGALADIAGIVAGTAGTNVVAHGPPERAVPGSRAPG